jgi:hypothetical protein
MNFNYIRLDWQKMRSVLNTINWNRNSFQSRSACCFPALQLHDEETNITVLCRHELADDTVTFIKKYYVGFSQLQINHRVWVIWLAELEAPEDSLKQGALFSEMREKCHVKTEGSLLLGYQLKTSQVFYSFRILCILYWLLTNSDKNHLFICLKAINISTISHNYIIVKLLQWDIPILLNIS